jgi:hypothetical protein
MYFVTLLMIDAGPLTSRLYHFVNLSLLFFNDVLDLSYVLITASSCGQIHVTCQRPRGSLDDDSFHRCFPCHFLGCIFIMHRYK